MSISGVCLRERSGPVHRFRPQQQQDRRPRFRRGFMNGQNVRPEKQEKEAEYKESWPCFARTLGDRFS